MCLTTEGQVLGADPQRPRRPKRDWEHGYEKNKKIKKINWNVCEVPDRRKGGRVELRCWDWDSLEAVEECGCVEVGRVPEQDRI